jgi:hypothetical protein
MLFLLLLAMGILRRLPVFPRIGAGWVRRQPLAAR